MSTWEVHIMLFQGGTFYKYLLAYGLILVFCICNEFLPSYPTTEIVHLNL